MLSIGTNQHSSWHLEDSHWLGEMFLSLYGLARSMSSSLLLPVRDITLDDTMLTGQNEQNTATILDTLVRQTHARR